MKMMNKIIVLDTSVILYDRNAIFNLSDNNVFLPLIVLEELDKKKTAAGILGENARFINRYLDSLREKGKLSEGVEHAEGKLFIENNYNHDVLETLGGKTNDHIILATCKYLQEQHKDARIRLVTKDINLRVKADALDIQASDYYTDYENVDEKWLGWKTIETAKETIDLVYKHNQIDNKWDLFENEFVILKYNQSSVMVQNRSNILHLVYNPDELAKMTGVKAKNKEQQFALQLLSDERIPLITMTGIPGSGKTYLALMMGLSELNHGNYERIIYTRPIQTVDKGIGFLPGTMEEKFDPFLAPLADNFQNAFGKMEYFHLLREKGQIDIAPISFIRGRSLKNCFVIVDEAQNATKHELKTIITRIAEGSKCVMIGDTKQIDTPYLDDKSNGLTIIADRFKNSTLSGHINFTKGYRSQLATEADDLIE